MSMLGGRAFGMAPAVANYQAKAQILQQPGSSPVTMFTFPAAGRIWAASVSIGMGSSGGTGSNQGYARVRIQGGATLAIAEAVVVGNPAADSNGSDLPYFGIAVPSGTVIQLDINGGATITGVVIRASGLVGVSIP